MRFGLKGKTSKKKQVKRGKPKIRGIKIVKKAGESGPNDEVIPNPDKSEELTQTLEIPEEEQRIINIFKHFLGNSKYSRFISYIEELVSAYMTLDIEHKYLILALTGNNEKNMILPKGLSDIERKVFGNHTDEKVWKEIIDHVNNTDAYLRAGGNKEKLPIKSMEEFEEAISDLGRDEIYFIDYLLKLGYDKVKNYFLYPNHRLYNEYGLSDIEFFKRTLNLYEENKQLYHLLIKVIQKDLGKDKLSQGDFNKYVLPAKQNLEKKQMQVKSRIFDDPEERLLNEDLLRLLRCKKLEGC